MSNRVPYQVEISIRSSAHVIFDFLNTPTGLSEWFADKVTEHEKVYTFYWEGSSEKATKLESVHEKSVKYKWDWMTKGESFEFIIEKNELTNNTVLIIKDFAEPKEIADQSNLWETQVHELMHRIGS